jgi:hypothetical protein
MRLRINTAVIQHAARYSPELGLLYLNNAKAACSTVKRSLWQAIDARTGRATYGGNPHSRKDWPFISDIITDAGVTAEQLRSAVTFSAVRNPFTRILASYLDKIGKDPFVWRPFAARFGLSGSLTQDQFTFVDFLRTIAAEPDELLDPHFRSQYMNLLAPIVVPHHIGFVEDMSSTAAFLESHGVPFSRFEKPETRAGELLAQHFTPEAVELVLQKYGTDFERYGYSRTLSDAAKPGSVPPAPGSVEELVRKKITGAIAPEFLDHTQREHDRFSRASGKEKFAIAVGAWEAEDNWRCVKSYAATVLNNEDFELADRMIARLHELRGRRAAS